LTPFSKDQEPVALSGIDQAVDMVKDWVSGSTADQLMNKYN